MTKIGSQMMVQRFSEIFSDRPGDTNLAEHRIDLTSDVPVHQTPYPVPFALKSSLKKELQQMKDPGIIRKSDSPYASPVVGSNRICIDFRRLNKITKTDPQPVPSPAVFPWIDNTVLLADKARIQVKTPYLSGEVEALCIPEVICDVVGNVPGARNPDDPDMTAMVGAVTTRSQARQEVKHKPHCTQEWIEET
ncbi:hypothetical protein RRG08_052727 [Elysia crispata]|uniref:Reverse transcriptase n=1 Tax=Elysia crispata TaxID=231223 RepID=A0AAE1EAG9_9GAST|nr:hypothetical protein RRG08_052727 [Elysia crispata]